jgi:hypothetical protein
MNKMPSLAGIERDSAETLAHACNTFARLNDNFLRHVSRCEWQEANYTDQTMIDLLRAWESPTPAN